MVWREIVIPVTAIVAELMFLLAMGILNVTMESLVANGVSSVSNVPVGEPSKRMTGK